MPSLNVAALLFLLLTTCIGGVEPKMEECCKEKRVGPVFYTLLPDHQSYSRELPEQCLNSCIYTVEGTSSPKFCFQTGDLPAECLSDIPGIRKAITEELFPETLSLLNAALAFV